MEPIGKLAVVALDCPDPHQLAAFYGALTGWPVVKDDGDWVELGSESGVNLAFQLATDHIPPSWPDPARPQQAHLDFDVADLATAAERVLALGARRAEFQPDEDFIVFLDPAGHPFCLVREDWETTPTAPI